MIKVHAKVATKTPDRLTPLRKLFQRASGSYATVGWQSQERYPEGPLVAQVAIWNEYGTAGGRGHGAVPARPFLRPAVDEARGYLAAARQRALERLASGTVTTEEALRSIAYPVQETIRNRIKSNVGPPLAARTAARKRAAGRPAVTLIDTRRLLDELSVVVHLTEKDRARDEDRGPPEQHGGGGGRASAAARAWDRAAARAVASKRKAERHAARGKDAARAQTQKAFAKAQAKGLEAARAKAPGTAPLGRTGPKPPRSKRP